MVTECRTGKITVSVKYTRLVVINSISYKSDLRDTDKVQGEDGQEVGNREEI